MLLEQAFWKRRSVSELISFFFKRNKSFWAILTTLARQWTHEWEEKNATFHAFASFENSSFHLYRDIGLQLIPLDMQIHACTCMFYTDGDDFARTGENNWIIKILKARIRSHILYLHFL